MNVGDRFRILMSEQYIRVQQAMLTPCTLLNLESVERRG
jgi:hypothetical protein